MAENSGEVTGLLPKPGETSKGKFQFAVEAPRSRLVRMERVNDRDIVEAEFTEIPDSTSPNAKIETSTTASPEEIELLEFRTYTPAAERKKEEWQKVKDRQPDTNSIYAADANGWGLIGACVQAYQSREDGTWLVQSPAKSPKNGMQHSYQVTREDGKIKVARTVQDWLADWDTEVKDYGNEPYTTVKKPKATYPKNHFFPRKALLHIGEKGHSNAQVPAGHDEYVGAVKRVAKAISESGENIQFGALREEIRTMNAFTFQATNSLIKNRDAVGHVRLESGFIQAKLRNTARYIKKTSK